MTDLPADIADRYRRLALRRNWQPETLAAVLRSAALYRALDEGTGQRGYFTRTDEQGQAELGTRWLWETVLVSDEVIAVKQIEVPAVGEIRRYCWQSLEDDTSGLTDHPLNPPQEELTPITRQDFYKLWNHHLSSPS